MICDKGVASVTLITHPNSRQHRHVGNQAIVCKLGSFQDSIFQPQVVFYAYLDHIPLCRIHGLPSNKQLHPIAALKLKLISLDAGLRMEGTPSMNLWDTILDFLNSQAGSDSMPCHQTQILKQQEPLGDIDYVLPGT